MTLETAGISAISLITKTTRIVKIPINTNVKKKLVRTCLDTLTFDLILVKLDQKQEFLIHEKLCTPL